MELKDIIPGYRLPGITPESITWSWKAPEDPDRDGHYPDESITWSWKLRILVKTCLVWLHSESITWSWKDPPITAWEVEHLNLLHGVESHLRLTLYSERRGNLLHGVEGVTRQTETDICGMNGGPLHGVGKEMVWGWWGLRWGLAV